MADIFPFFASEPAKERELPLCRETAWDFKKGMPLFKDGEPIIVTGADAVAVWAYKAIKTPRARYEIYSFDFGCDAQSIIGQNYSDGATATELSRCIEEALLQNPYIKTAKVISTSFEGCLIEAEVEISTIYGSVTINTQI